MALTPEQLQELQELEELEQLEKQFGGKEPSTASGLPSAQSYLPKTPFLDKVGKTVDQATSPDGVQNLAAANLMPGAASALVKGKQLGGLGRTAVAMAQGAAEGGMPLEENPDKNRGLSALIGAGMGGAVVGIPALVGAARDVGTSVARKAARFTPGQAEAYVQDPKGVARMAGLLDDNSQTHLLQDEAAGAINKSRGVLKGQGLQASSALTELLKGKQASVSPGSLMGHVDEVDQVLRSKVPGGVGPLPERMDVDANELNALKRQLQDAAKFQPSSILDPAAVARQKGAGQAQYAAKSALEQVDPGVAPLNKAMQQSMEMQQTLRQGGKNPLQFLSSEKPDTVARLSRIESKGAGGLLDFGDKYGAAKSMSMKDVDDALTRQVQKAAGRAGLRGLNILGKAAEPAATAVEDPRSLQVLLNLLNTSK